MRGDNKADKTGSGDKDSEGGVYSRTSGRALLSYPPPPTEASTLGSTALQQYLPTWSALAAEAVWLRGSEAVATSEGVVAGGGGVNVGGVGVGGGGGGSGGNGDGAVVGRGQDCVPAPSLDPSMEKVLMDWIQSRVDR